MPAPSSCWPPLPVKTTTNTVGQYAQHDSVSRVCVLLDPGARPFFVQLLRFRTATGDFFLNQRPYHVQFFGAQYGLGAEVAGQTEADACC